MKIFNFILATLITTTFVNAQKNLDEKELYNRYPSDKIKQIEYKLGKREQLIAGPYVNEKGESVMITLSKGKMGALQQLKVIIFNENFTASTEKFIDIPQLKNEKPAMYDHFLKDNTLFLLLNVDIKSKTGSSRTIYAYKLDINTKKTIGSPKKIKELAYDKKGADTSSKLLFSNHKDFMAFAEANLNEENRTTTVTYEVFAIERIKPLVVKSRENLRELKIRNVLVKHADGFDGWEEDNKFDGIICDNTGQFNLHEVDGNGNLKRLSDRVLLCFAMRARSSPWDNFFDDGAPAHVPGTDNDYNQGLGTRGLYIIILNEDKTKVAFDSNNAIWDYRAIYFYPAVEAIGTVSDPRIVFPFATTQDGIFNSNSTGRIDTGSVTLRPNFPEH